MYRDRNQALSQTSTPNDSGGCPKYNLERI